MLGVLRREDEELALAPQPSLEHIRSLVERARARRARVELHVDGDAARAARRRRPHRPTASSQEALAARASRRAPARAGRAALRARRASTLEVRDDGAGAARDLRAACASASRSTAASCGPRRRRGGGHAVARPAPGRERPA